MNNGPTVAIKTAGNNPGGLQGVMYPPRKKGEMGAARPVGRGAHGSLTSLRWAEAEGEEPRLE